VLDGLRDRLRLSGEQPFNGLLEEIENKSRQVVSQKG
jgi:hypothetical protein